jgi:uncharacterized membrane protein YgcG
VKRALLAITLTLSIVAARLDAQEKILAYHSDITVAADGSMEVAETIRVRAEGDQIRRGIYRDFPTDYRDARNNRVRVDFAVLSATRDGASESWRTESRSNGVRVYLGQADVLLDSGEYTYVIRYRTTRQLGFFDSHDELYWNVTGNGWGFTIDTVSATVRWPGAPDAAAVRVEAYTGEQGAKGSDYVARVTADGVAEFGTTRPLSPSEGLTLVAMYPKGFVTPPSDTEKVSWFLVDNAAVLVLALGGLGTLLFVGLIWLQKGVDPLPGVIVPQYDPPPGYSPASLRFIERQMYDDKCFAADLVMAAVHGRLLIDARGKRDWVLVQRDPSAVTLTSVQLLADRLLPVGETELALEQVNHPTIGGARSAHDRWLEAAHHKTYFQRNAGWLLLASLFLVVTIGGAAMVAGGERGGTLAFGSVWLLIWGGFSALAFGAARRRGAGCVSAVVGSVIGLVTMLIALSGIAMVTAALGLAAGGIMLVVLGGFIVFAKELPAPTTKGRALLDRIEGLRLYLGVAEQQELASLSAPPLSADRYERLLPYAMALDVEDAWTKQFTLAVGAAAAAAATAGMTWYRGSGKLANLGAMSSAIGSSLSTAISSSASPPGSSSGGGGGGSSGGGGGGGGGGGW